jgi:hypothetical protein
MITPPDRIQYADEVQPGIKAAWLNAQQEATAELVQASNTHESQINGQEEQIESLQEGIAGVDTKATNAGRTAQQALTTAQQALETAQNGGGTGDGEGGGTADLAAVYSALPDLFGLYSDKAYALARNSAVGAETTVLSGKLEFYGRVGTPFVGYLGDSFILQAFDPYPTDLTFEALPGHPADEDGYTADDLPAGLVVDNSSDLGTISGTPTVSTFGLPGHRANVTVRQNSSDPNAVSVASVSFFIFPAS